MKTMSDKHFTEIQWVRDEDGYIDAMEATKMRGPVFSPGNLVKFKDGEVSLVGDMSQSTGICDCCGQGYTNAVSYYHLLSEMAKQLQIAVDNICYLKPTRYDNPEHERTFQAMLDDIYRVLNMYSKYTKASQ